MTVVVFGGTGFLGRRVVRHLLDHKRPVRIASRHADRGAELFAAEKLNVESVRADVHDAKAVADALTGANAAVNAISLYVELGKNTFTSVHVDAARSVARCAREGNVDKLVHVSGIGSDARSSSPYIRSRGQGEEVVRGEFADATIVRPAVMFGPDDAFLTVLIKLLKWLPAYPLFGRGLTKLQPAHVDDVAKAIVRLIESDHRERVLELGGPDVLTYRQLLEVIARHAGTKRLLFPMPFPLWYLLARISQIMPNPPITLNQVDLMEKDTIASSATPGFAVLGIDPRSIEQVLVEILSRSAEPSH